MPPWVQDGGTAAMLKRLRDPKMRARVRRDLTTPTTRWENEWLEVAGPEDFLIVSVHNPTLKALPGKTLAEIAAIWQEDPIDAVMDVLVKDSGSTGVVVFAIAEPDIELALAQPWVSVGCDEYGASPQGPLSEISVHPRGYGTFPRILRKFVREKPLLSLADAIRKFSALPAQRMHLIDRGVLKEGVWADIVVFDPQTITDLATFEKPHQLSQGLHYVLVNGIPVIDHAHATNALPGKVLRGPGFSAAPQP
jgi:N-acyl-D-amino-acid deacylase